MFGIVNKAEIDVFLELSCFFDDPADVGSLISGSSAFSKTSLNIWKFIYKYDNIYTLDFYQILQRVQKISIAALLTMSKPLTVWIRNCGKF